MLKEYIKNVYLLEASLQNQNTIYQRLQNEKYSLQHVRGEVVQEYENFDKPWEVLGGLICAGIVCGGIGGVIGLIVDMCTKGILGWLLYEVSDLYLLPGMSCGGIFGVFFMILFEVSGYKGVKENNKRIELENNEIQRRNALQKQRALQKISVIDQELDIIKENYRKTSEILNKYYEQDIIYGKYRNFVAITTIYEYLESGRCNELQGSTGAYNLYESELRQNIIIGKLDTIISKLEQIRENQYLLYTAIREGQNQAKMISEQLSQIGQSMEKIEQHTQISAYNESLIAQNTSLLSWIEVHKLIEKA